MSYDIRVCVKVEGCDKYATVGIPEHDSPTYNLRDMFVACMGWDYRQGENYPAKSYLRFIEHGISELNTNRSKYEKYNPPNGWGSIDSAIEALEGLRDTVYECAEDLPIECLYFRW